MEAEPAGARHGHAAIHPTAIIHPGAVLAEGVTVGAFAVIGQGVEIGAGCEIMHHASVQGPTRLGRRNRVFPFASLGTDPQDKKFTGRDVSRLEIGDDNVIREFVTINRGSHGPEGLTRVGSDNWIMAYCHIAHDCRVGDHTVFANASTLGGHVAIEDRVTLGGFTAVHQFCTIGTLTMTGGQTMIAQDVPPYVIATGNRVRLYGVNKIGLERNGVPPEEIRAIEKAYRIFFRSRLAQADALARLDAELGGSPGVRHFAAFVRSSKRGICR
ncbi:MAG: acyl-ACP--UDP-N-acetylglucosamine O-acyltransferase [Candidatus Lambdaproteobacteria bacterium]|nr:acyl-ACP--UDP-N-acetylglucosamine O-acyltransferase [Candidatus Lambdaproteobacteria bacterium]